MRANVWAACIVVGGLSIGLGACEGAARVGCTAPEDVAVKLTTLTDALGKAQAKGTIDTMTAGTIAGRIMEAGQKHAADPAAYCAALEQIRLDAKL